jgi:protein-L-isoaspartate(D-aspartate) O-methyltransferase
MTASGISSSDARPDFTAARNEMVARQIRSRGIVSTRVLDAMAAVPRHEFVPVAAQGSAYSDEALPIGDGQTISQPFIVAAMSNALQLIGSERVLEIGGGCGYQAAVLSLLAQDVVVLELRASLADESRERLTRLGYCNVRVEEGDGSLGRPVGAPYDAILVSAAAPAIPPPLIEQLAEGARLVIPVGDSERQSMLRIVKRAGGLEQESLLTCRFVPLLGRHGWPDSDSNPVLGPAAR